MNTELVTVQGASFGYRRRGAAVVCNVGFAVAPGDFVVLRGPNGCGKSTVIKGVLGIAHTLCGRVTWAIDRSNIGYVPQESTISGGVPYTAYDIVRCGIDKPCGSVRESIHKALAALEMDSGAGIRFGDLSGGQKRRVLFARALVRNPRCLILDEPTANVDVHTEMLIGRLIDGIISRNDAAVIAVAHTATFTGTARVISVGNGRCHD